MRTVVICVLLLFFLGTGILIYHNRSPSNKVVHIDTVGQPTYGNGQAKAHIVVFTDPKCPACARLHLHFLPLLEKSYIDKGLATFTVIPVSVIPGSSLMANAWLCAYNSEPGAPHTNHFFKYLHTTFLNQGPVHLNWADEDQARKLAKEADPAINIQKLATCIENLEYSDQILKNTKMLQKFLGQNALVPAVFVNGRWVKNVSLSTIEEYIERVLQKSP
ncbi:MAG: Disulfide bond formation protein D [Chlamydiia bacterium]|nr:Disulfide bond formation protein D [Chlamydiia bacterium]MCH9615667.1 Disulfide bond formation protein D [Chlamydiia bacterium]MCH9628930.1 Disulfide bond formation protein D [Chlamydiia bacterium]